MVANIIYFSIYFQHFSKNFVGRMFLLSTNKYNCLANINITYLSLLIKIIYIFKTKNFWKILCVLMLNFNFLISPSF